MIKCIIFDFGGTLVDFTDSVKSAHFLNLEFDVLKKFGYSFSDDQLKDARLFIEKNSKDFLKGKNLSDPTTFFVLLLTALGVAPTKKLLNTHKKAFLSKKEDFASLSPHVEETLNFLNKRKILIGVITNSRDNLNRKLALKLGIMDYFDFFLMTHKYHTKKSELTIFNRFFEKINRNRVNKIQPFECLMVGNDLKEDVAAKKFGIKVAILKPTIVGEINSSKLKPDFFINDLSEVKALVYDS